MVSFGMVVFALVASIRPPYHTKSRMTLRVQTATTVDVSTTQVIQHTARPVPPIQARLYILWRSTIRHHQITKMYRYSGLEGLAKKEDGTVVLGMNQSKCTVKKNNV